MKEPFGLAEDRGRSIVYRSRAARDAASGHGPAYAAEVERSALRMHAYYLARDELEMAEYVLSRSLSQALQGNDGD